VLARKVLAAKPGLPVVICTGYSEKISEEEADRMGLAGYLEKPLDRRQLAEVVRRILDKRASPAAAPRD
jgi:DNA-binding NtrC family response regulator